MTLSELDLLEVEGILRLSQVHHALAAEGVVRVYESSPLWCWEWPGKTIRQLEPPQDMRVDILSEMVDWAKDLDNRVRNASPAVKAAARHRARWIEQGLGCYEKLAPVGNDAIIVAWVPDLVPSGWWVTEAVFRESSWIAALRCSGETPFIHLRVGYYDENIRKMSVRDIWEWLGNTPNHNSRELYQTLLPTQPGEIFI